MLDGNERTTARQNNGRERGERGSGEAGSADGNSAALSACCARRAAEADGRQCRARRLFRAVGRERGLMPLVHEARERVEGLRVSEMRSEMRACAAGMCRVTSGCAVAERVADPLHPRNLHSPRWDEPAQAESANAPPRRPARSLRSSRHTRRAPLPLPISPPLPSRPPSSPPLRPRPHLRKRRPPCCRRGGRASRPRPTRAGRRATRRSWRRTGAT